MNSTRLTHDAATVSFDSTDVAGITVDDDGTATFDWSEVPVVRLDEPPHAEAFDTNEFYKIEGATVARPIKQPYRVGDDIKWFKKPAEELRKMAWSLDNAPFTLGHPDTGMVKDVGDIHGFWKAPRYNADEERLKEDLYIPTNDTDAIEFISDHQDVSIGFYNRLQAKYEGDTGDLTDDDVDGFQTNMYGDHVAGVKRGRCSAEQGCGLDGDHGHGRVVMRGVEPSSEAFLDAEGDLDLSVPEDAQSAAQNFLDAVEEGKVPDSCGGPDGTGRRRAGMFAEGGELSLETWVTGGTDAVANWHPRHEGNEEYDESEVETPWEDCGYAMFKAWGGAAAREKAARLKDQYEESQDDSTSFLTKKDQTKKGDGDDKVIARHGRRKGEDAHIDWEEGDKVEWQVMPEMTGVVTHVPEETNDYVMVDKHNADGEPSGVTLTAGPADLLPLGTLPEYDIAPTVDGGFTLDYESEGDYYAIAPSETSGEDPKYPINSCSDVQDAWHLRGHGDYDISQETLENRIQAKARDLDCEVPGTEENMDNACNCGDNTKMTDDNNGFDIPQMSMDALAERHDEVAALRESKDELEATVDEVREELEDHGIDLDGYDCPCDAIHDLAEARDEAQSQVEGLEGELDDYREEERQEALDALSEYLDDTEEYQDADLEEIQDELERVQKVADNLNVDVKNVETDASDSTQTSGTRKFGRGHATSR
jgi:hypothetical protein